MTIQLWGDGKGQRSDSDWMVCVCVFVCVHHIMCVSELAGVGVMDLEACV